MGHVPQLSVRVALASALSKSHDEDRATLPGRSGLDRLLGICWEEGSWLCYCQWEMVSHQGGRISKRDSQEAAWTTLTDWTGKLRSSGGGVAPKGIGSDDMTPDGISFVHANPKYRQFKNGDNLLEYHTAFSGLQSLADWRPNKTPTSRC